MIDVKQAVQLAKDYASGVLGVPSPTLEEIEREQYKSRDVWKITLGLPSNTYNSGRAALGLPPREYKSFVVDAENGEILAMKIRELTA